MSSTPGKLTTGSLRVESCSPLEEKKTSFGAFAPHVLLTARALVARRDCAVTTPMKRGFLIVVRSSSANVLGLL